MSYKYWKGGKWIFISWILSWERKQEKKLKKYGNSHENSENMSFIKKICRIKLHSRISAKNQAENNLKDIIYKKIIKHHSTNLIK